MTNLRFLNFVIFGFLITRQPGYLKDLIFPDLIIYLSFWSSGYNFYSNLMCVVCLMCFLAPKSYLSLLVYSLINPRFTNLAAILNDRSSLSGYLTSVNVSKLPHPRVRELNSDFYSQNLLSLDSGFAQSVFYKWPKRLESILAPQRLFEFHFLYCGLILVSVNTYSVRLFLPVIAFELMLDPASPST